MAATSEQTHENRADVGAALQSARREVRLSYEQARRANRAVAQLEEIVLASLGIKYVPPKEKTQ